MPLFGKIVVIKRNGTDGTHFPLTVNSCTFGRKKECDIRIQLPQVSKEHCKIEVNENKEAILINLSTVNPTQLNGSNFQQPIYLKHGDVLTIIDRSFRFEYPPAPHTRKRISRSEEKETLQVLHVQQVEQEKLHPQTSECKNLQISDEKFQWEGQKTDGSDEQSTQNTTRQNESICKIRRSGRKSMSPFGTLYEFMKHKVDTKLTDESFNNKISIQQKEHSPRKDSIDIAASQTPHKVFASGQTIHTEETETAALENFEQSINTKNQGINMIVSNPMFVKGNSSRRSCSIPQICAANERQDREEINVKENVQNVKENEDSEVIKSSDNDASKSSGSTSCSTVALEYTEMASCYERSISLSTEIGSVEAKTNLNTSGSVESVFTWSKAGGESLETCSSPYSRQASGMLQTELDSSLGLKRTEGISTETEGDIMPVMTREDDSGVLIENKYLNTNRNNKLSDTEQPIDAQIMEETKSDPLQSGHFETIACFVNHNDGKSPRRSSRQRRNVSNADSKIMEETLVTAKDVSPFKGVPEENLVKYWSQEYNGYTEERPTTENLEKSFVMKNIVGSSCLSKSRHKSCIQMPAEDVVQEKNMSNQCNIKKEPAVQRSPQKRKVGELDLSVQPLGKRKRVSFGRHLSPELFDKRLPPNSPLKRGAIPARFSLPYENSPRAVLKKASEFKQYVIKGFSGKDQQDNTLSRKRSPTASPMACRSPSMFSCNLPHVRGRFSVTHVDAPSLSSSEQNVPGSEMDVNKEVSKPETSHQESQNTQSVRRSNKFVSKRTSLRRRSGAVDSIRAKRQSGASEANLIVSRSWAEVVKQGVPKSQQTTALKCGLKRRPAKKMPSKAPKSNASLKTPTRKVKDYFTTGHANSPAPIVVGKAHTSIVKITAQVPKVMFNYTLKQQQDTNESFTGMTEMFHTPLNWKHSVSTVQKSNLSTPEDGSEIHTAEESGKINLSIKQICDNQNAESPILRKVSQISTVGQHELKVSSGQNSALDENVGENSSLVTGETMRMEEIKDAKENSDCIETHSGTKRLMRSPKQEPELTETLSGNKRVLRTPKKETELVEVLSGAKRLIRTLKTDPELVEMLSGAKSPLKTPKPEPVETLSEVKRLLRTPKQEPVLAEALSGAKRPLKTPKQKPEPVEALSGVKRLLRTPRQKPEPVDALSGVKRLLRTPRQKPEPVEALSGVKRPLKTPKQKPEPVEALSGVKRLLRTPKQEPEPVEQLSGSKRLLKTPKQKPEPVEALSGVKRLLRTPKQKPQPVDALSGVKRLLRTPKQKPEPVEALSGVKRLLRTPKQEPEPVEQLSGSKRLLKTPKQKPEPVEALSGVKRLLKTPKQKPEPVDALSGVKRLLRTPNCKAEPVTDDIYSKVLNSPEEFFDLNNVAKEKKEKIGLMEDMEGIQKLFRTPKQKSEPVEDMIGISRILKTPKQKFMPVDGYLGLQRLMAEPKQNSLNAEIDYTGVKELLEPVDEYLVKVSESVNKPHEISSSELGYKENGPEREEFWQKTGLEDSFEKKIPNAVPRRADDDHDELQDYLTHTSCSSLNDVKGEHVENIVTVQTVPETFKSDGMVFQSGAVTDLNEESFVRQGDPVEINAENLETLSSVEKPRKGKADESSFMEEHDTSETRQTRNSSRAKLANCMQTNENFDQNVLETSHPKESESNPTALDNEATERLREKSIETNGNMDFGNIRQAQQLLELSKEMSMDTQVSVNRRRVVAKLNRQAEESLHLEENAANQDYADQLISKTSLRSRNQKIKDESKSEFTETVPNEQMQSSNLETSKRNSGNKLVKKSTRERKATSVDREMEAVDGEKHILKTSLRSRNKKENNEPKPEFTKINPEEKLQSSDLETSKRNPGNQLLKKNTRRKATSVDREMEAADGEKHISKTSLRSRNKKENNEPKPEFTKINPEEKLQSSDLETSKRNSGNQLLKKNTRRRKATSAETEIEAVHGEKHISPKIFKLENLENHPAEMKAGTVRKRNNRKVQFLLDKGTSEVLEETSVFDGKGNIHQEQHNVFSERNTSPVKENTSQKNKNDAVSVVSPSHCIWLSSENQALAEISKDRENFTLANKDAASFVQGECLQDINSDKNLNETEMVPWENIQTSVEHSAPKRQKVAVAKKNPPRRGRSRAASPDPATENGSKVTLTIEKQPRSIENSIFSKENQPKRGRRGKVAPVSQALGTPDVPKEEPSTISSGFTQGESLQGSQNEKNINEVQKVCLDNIQAIVEHIVPKRQKAVRGNLLQNDRSTQGVSHEPAMENDNKENPNVENQDMVVENAFTAEENRPKRGRRRKFASVTQKWENLTVPKEDTSTSRFSFAQENCLHYTHNEENSNETQKVVLDNTESSLEHILPKRQKVVRWNLPQRGRSKQVVSDEHPTEKDNKDTSDVVNKNMVVDNAFAVKENLPKRGRGRKVSTVPQILESDNFPLSRKDKSGAEEQDEALEMATAANNPSSRGRCRNTLLTSSVPASKKPKVVSNVNQEEMAIVLKDVTKENVSKRGRRKLPVYEASTETNIQQRAPISKPTCVKGKKVSADSLFENKSKRSQGENIVLAFQTPTSPALKRSIALPSLSDNNETISENQNFFIENNVAGKENLAVNGRRNKKIVSSSTSVRRKCKLPEKDKCQEKQNVNMEKTGISNDKQSRRAMRKVGASETTFLKEKCELPESSDGIPKDQQVNMANTISGMEDALQGRRKRILKGKNLPKHSDQKNTLSHGNENLSKRGRRKQVTTEPETHSTISGMKKCLFVGNTTSASDAENTGSTLQRGRRKKIKEEHISATTESAVETPVKTKASIRTRKRVL